MSICYVGAYIISMTRETQICLSIYRLSNMRPLNLLCFVKSSNISAVSGYIMDSLDIEKNYILYYPCKDIIGMYVAKMALAILHVVCRPVNVLYVHRMWVFPEIDFRAHVSTLKICLSPSFSPPL